MSKTYKQKSRELEAQLAVMASENEALRHCLSKLAEGPAAEYMEAPWASVAQQYMREVEALKDKMARMQAGQAKELWTRDEVVGRLAQQLRAHEAYRDELEARHLEDMDTIRELRAELEARK